MTGPPRTASWTVATLGGLGHLPGAPGTYGSLAVLPLAWLGPMPALWLGLAVSVVGLFAVRAVLKHSEAKDPGWIVVDEAAGMLIALGGLADEVSALGVLIAFALFRVLDVFKPWPMSWADRRPGAEGVMLDDILAGTIVLWLLVLIRSLAPGHI
jgi:phosphatidylglycerophosphatase A